MRIELRRLFLDEAGGCATISLIVVYSEEGIAEGLNLPSTTKTEKQAEVIHASRKATGIGPSLQYPLRLQFSM